MLELIRKQQKWILIIVAIVVVLAFAWWGDFGQGDANQGGRAVISFGGKSYTESQIQSISRGAGFAQMMFPKHNYLMGAYAKYSGSGADYAINTIALRNHAADFGVVVSPEEIDKRMLAMPAFRTPETREQTVRMFGSSGLGLKEMAEIVGDAIRLEKLDTLLSAGLLASDTGAEYDYAARHQTIFASKAVMPKVAPDSIEVTETELKEAFEARKEQLQTSRKVSIRYVYFKSPQQEAAETKKAADEAAAKETAEKLKADEEAAAKEAAEKLKADEEAAAKEAAEKLKADEEAAAKDAAEKLKADEEAAANKSSEGNPGVEPELPEGGASDAPGIEGDEGGGGDEGSSGADPEKNPEPSTGKDSEGSKTDGANEKIDIPVDAPSDPKIEDPTTGEPANEGPTDLGPSEDELKQLVKEHKILVDQFWNEFFVKGEYDSTVDFVTMAKDPQYKLEVIETETFSSEDPPEAIKGQRALIQAALSQTKDLPLSDPIPAGGDQIGYYIFELIKVEEPKEKTFEQAKAELEELLRNQKAEEATLAKVDEARAKLVELLAAGKTFAEAAKEAQFTLEEIEPFSPADPPLDLPNIRDFYLDLMQLAPGEVSEPIILAETVTVIHVSKRELWKRVDSGNLKDAAKQQAVSDQSRTLLRDWFLNVRDAWDEKPIAQGE